jgi:hypothetical protein
MCLPLDLIHKVNKILVEDPDISITRRKRGEYIKSLEFEFLGRLVTRDSMDSLPQRCKERIEEIWRLKTRYLEPDEVKRISLLFFIPAKTLEHECDYVIPRPDYPEPLNIHYLLYVEEEDEGIRIEASDELGTVYIYGTSIPFDKRSFDLDYDMDVVKVIRTRSGNVYAFMMCYRPLTWTNEFIARFFLMPLVGGALVALLPFTAYTVATQEAVERAKAARAQTQTT